MLNKKAIKHVYQPVFHLKQGEIIGYEALMRYTEFPRPDVLFKIAREVGELYQLDIFSIAKAITTFPAGHTDYLFINVFPSTLLVPEFSSVFEQIMSAVAIKPQQIVFEMNETLVENDIWYVHEFKTNFHHLRRQGVKIALDDVGSGTASLKK